MFLFIFETRKKTFVGTSYLSHCCATVFRLTLFS